MARNEDARRASIRRALDHHLHVTGAVTAWSQRDDGKFVVSLPGFGWRTFSVDEALGLTIGLAAGVRVRPEAVGS